jgi:hypothetical protein
MSGFRPNRTGQAGLLMSVDRGRPGFKVDFDMALLVLASGLYRLFASRMRGYDDAQARLIFRDLIDMPADVAITDD